MSQTPRILAFAGSARTNSLNKKLLAVAARAVEAAGGEVTLIDLRDFPLPIYDGDLEAAKGLPVNAVKLKALFGEHRGLIISSPENNASVSSLLKNTIDWLSRPVGEVSGLTPFQGKVAGLLAASPGNLGGVRALPHLRAILDTLGVLVLPGQVAVSRADKAFGPDGGLIEARYETAIRTVCERLVETCRRLN